MPTGGDFLRDFFPPFFFEDFFDDFFAGRFLLEDFFEDLLLRLDDFFFVAMLFLLTNCAVE